MTDEQTKQAILGFTEFFKGITGNQNLEIPSEIAEKYGIQAQADGEYISRKALLEDLYKRDYTKFTHRDFVALVQYQDIVAIPSAEPKTGHWIEKDGFDGDVYYDCSECGESWTTIEGTPWDNEWNYCPNCGARMVEPQERSK